MGVESSKWSSRILMDKLLDERKEPCTLRNVVYESECAKCNPPGTRKVADRDGLGEKRDRPSLYVGETAVGGPHTLVGG